MYNLYVSAVRIELYIYLMISSINLYQFEMMRFAMRDCIREMLEERRCMEMLCL